MSKIDVNGVRSTYRRYAPMYDWAFGPILDAGRNALAAELVKLAPRRVLEVGVGTGLAFRRYPQGELRCGLDLSMEMLRKAQGAPTNDAVGPSILICADAEKLPFATSSFDCLTLPYVVSVTPSPEALLAEARRVCARGGHILILNHFRSSRMLGLFERLLAPFARGLGFRPNLEASEVLDCEEWSLCSSTRVNLLGITRLFVFENRKSEAPDDMTAEAAGTLP